MDKNTKPYLTEREREVLALCCFSLKETAQILDISVTTVKTLRINIYNKLTDGYKNGSLLPEALIKAVDLGLLNWRDIVRRKS